MDCVRKKGGGKEELWLGEEVVEESWGAGYGCHSCLPLFLYS